MPESDTGQGAPADDELPRADHSPQYRVHPALLGFPATVDGARRFVLETDAKVAPILVNDPTLIWALASLPETFDRSQAQQIWSHEPTAAGREEEIWRYLYDQGLLVSTDAVNETFARANLWATYGWHEAFSFQEATRSYPFVNMTGPTGFREDRGRMTRYRAESPPPPVYARPNIGQNAPHRLALTDWAQRASDASEAGFFKGDILPRTDLDALGFVLDYCAGWRGRIDLGAQGEVLLKSVPSGGARHPAELLVAIFSGFTGACPGTYRYNVEHHALDCIQEGDYAQICRDATFDLFEKYDRPPIALVVFATRMERAMWRYRDPRSARAPFADIGHVLMAFRTAAEATGLSHSTYQKFRELPLCQLFEIDPLVEPPIYVGALV